MQDNKTDQKKIENEKEYEIIQSILNGNIEQFKHLQKKYSRIISNLIRKMIKDEDDVADLTQDTFIKAYNALPNFQNGYAFSSWLFKIASNTCIDFIRKNKFQFVYIDDNNNDEDKIYEIKDSNFQPDLEFQKKERKTIIQDAINQLPEIYQKVIKMRHEEELEYQEIADKLELPLGTVKVNIFRARKQLLEILKNEDI